MSPAFSWAQSGGKTNLGGGVYRAKEQGLGVIKSF